MTPSVTVCVPALNAESFLDATIRSVLAQSYADWELVVVDNASSDRTGEIARSFDDPRITVVTNEHTVPMADNWNRAVQASSAPWIKLLCADDVLAPDCLSQQMAAVDRVPGASLVAGRRDVIDDLDQVILEDRGLSGITGVHPGDEVIRELTLAGTNTVGWPAACLFRRDHFDAVGGFAPEWSLLMDLELWTRLLAKGDFVGLDASVASFRVWSRAASATADALGGRHRALLRRLAADPDTGLDRRSLWIGLVRASIESVKRRLLYAAVGSQSPTLRRLPSLLVQPTRFLARRR